MRLCSSAFPPMHSMYATRRRSSAMHIHWVETFRSKFLNFPALFSCSFSVKSLHHFICARFISSSLFVKSLHLVIHRDIYYLWNIHRSSMLEIKMVRRIISWKTQVYKNFPTGMISTHMVVCMYLSSAMGGLEIVCRTLKTFTENSDSKHHLLDLSWHTI